MKSEIEKLESVHPDLITTFLTTGDGEGIPEDVKTFLKQLQWAAEIYEYERNITREDRQLKQRIAAQQKISLDVRTCMTRINQAISYFNVDCNVSIKVWENDFANKYEDLAKLCSAKRDYKMQKACMDQALECRAEHQSRQKPTETSAWCSSSPRRLLPRSWVFRKRVSRRLPPSTTAASIFRSSMACLSRAQRRNACFVMLTFRKRKLWRI